MHCCTTVCSQVVLIASGSPFNPSHTAIITSTMPRFFTSEKICSQNRAPSAPSPAQMPRMSWSARCFVDSGEKPEFIRTCEAEESVLCWLR